MIVRILAWLVYALIFAVVAFTVYDTIRDLNEEVSSLRQQIEELQQEPCK